jgi:hypothetical protein
MTAEIVSPEQAMRDVEQGVADAREAVLTYIGEHPGTPLQDIVEQLTLGGNVRLPLVSRALTDLLTSKEVAFTTDFGLKLPVASS